MALTNSETDGYGLTCAASVKPEHVSWLWPGHIPTGKIVVLDGDPGVGKSTLAVDLATRVTTGHAWPDGSAGCAPGNVLLMSAEDGKADTVVPRLRAAHADMSATFFLDSVSGKNGRPMPPVLPGALAGIGQAIADVSAKLLVLDVFMSWLDSSVNSYKDQDIRARVMTPLADICEHTGCTALLLRHLNKTGGTALNRGGGSIGIVGAARAAFVAGHDQNDPERYILAPSKMNIARMPRAIAYMLVDDSPNGCARVQWLGETDNTADDLVALSDDTHKQTGRGEVSDWLVSLLSDGPMTFTDIMVEARDAGYSAKQLSNARERASNPQIITVPDPTHQGRGRRRLWQLANTSQSPTCEMRSNENKSESKERVKKTNTPPLLLTSKLRSNRPEANTSQRSNQSQTGVCQTNTSQYFSLVDDDDAADGLGTPSPTPPDVYYADVPIPTGEPPGHAIAANPQDALRRLPQFASEVNWTTLGDAELNTIIGKKVGLWPLKAREELERRKEETK